MEAEKAIEDIPIPLKTTIVTLLTEDSYLPGVQALLTSLQNVKCSHAFRVMVGPKVTNVALLRLRKLSGLAGTISVGDIKSSTITPSEVSPAFAQSQLTKLNVWNLVDFDRVLYIDADCLVIQNIDELFELDVQFSACPDIFPPDKFNAGVMLLKPDNAVFQSMIESIDTTLKYDGGDTGFLNAFFKDWYISDSKSRLPFGYNAQRTMHWFLKSNPSYWESIQPLKIIHFSSGPKPWEVQRNKVLGQLELIWWETYSNQNLTGKEKS